MIYRDETKNKTCFHGFFCITVLWALYGWMQFGKKNTITMERINPHTTSEYDEVIDNIFWTCPDCGRSNQGVMEHCPICGAGRPETEE